MTIDVQMPDGTVIRGVPDDITKSELGRQYTAFSQAETEKQERIEGGDLPETTVLGAVQSVGGAVEVFGSMLTGFISAVPGLAAGLGAMAGAKDIGVFREAFDEQAEKSTYAPRTKKGQRYEESIANTYNEYVEEKWGEYVGELVDEGRISPAEAAYYRTSADALLMGLFMRAGRYANQAGRLAADAAAKSRRIVDINPTEIVPAGGAARPAIGAQKRLPAPESAIRQAAEAKAAETSQQNIFRNRQAGAVDMNVIAEGVARVLRPATQAAKGGMDLSHALARQVGFKHVTDIRKIDSPTAKMLADRIMPLENSTIPLGAGFHELVALNSGEFSTRIENVLEPLRRHVVNKNALKSARLVALPKEVNNAIFRGLDTGKIREDLAPATLAIRGILNDALTYQQEAGVIVEKRPNFFPHMWNRNKIAREEYGRKNGGRFTKYLMEEEGLSFQAAQKVVATITHEEGFLDFVEDTGGRLQRGQDYSSWAKGTRAYQVGGGAAKPGHIKRRVLKGDFDKAKDWLVTDLETVLTSYVNRAVRYAEYARIAGQGEGKLNHLVRKIIEEQEQGAVQGGNLKASSPHQTAQNIYDMFDAMQGRFHEIKNPVVRSASRAYSGYQVIQKLGLVALAQFPETMMPAAKFRVTTRTKAAPGIPIPLKSYAVGMADSAMNAMSAASTMLTGKRAISKTEIRQHLERIGVIYPSALQSSSSRMAGPTGVLTNRTIRAFGMEAITNLQRAVAYDTINSMIRENARALAKGLVQGKKYKQYRQELIELGIKPDDAIDWYRAGMPKDHPISKKFDLALVRGIDTTIIMPKAANAPRLYNDPRFQLPLIFTRFFTVFGNTVLKSIGKKLYSNEVTAGRKLGSVSALIAAVGIAYYTQFLREDISGYQFRDEDDPMRVVDAVDRAGLTAMFTRLYPLFSAYKYGMGSKYVANIALGPAGGDIAGLIEAAKGSNEQKARWMAKQTPFLTITPTTEDAAYEFYLELIEAME